MSVVINFNFKYLTDTFRVLEYKLSLHIKLYTSPHGQPGLINLRLTMKSEAKNPSKAAPSLACLPTPVPVVGEDQLTTSEMENVTTVFRYFETGLREATILPKVQK